MSQAEMSEMNINQDSQRHAQIGNTKSFKDHKITQMHKNANIMLGPSE